MKILVIGSGGREHAICAKFKESSQVEEVFAAPGNAGMARIATCLRDLEVSNHEAVIEFCKSNKVGLVFVGPEQPLVDGLVDDLKDAGIRAFGPSKAAARLEGSKEFMKDIASKSGVPTARYQAFTDEAKAFAFGQELGFPCVVKTDGLAAGKGVYIVHNIDELEEVLEAFFGGLFGEAGKKVIIEEFLEGLELSYFTICDGKDFVVAGAACDHKKVGEGETGLNTGGMGTYAPAPFLDEKLENEVLSKLVKPTLDKMADDGNPFRGILFTGIILTKNGPKLLEYNVRFGDPETQVILPRLKVDFVDLIVAACDGKLGDLKVEIDRQTKFVCVVMCAKGYPGAYAKGTKIEGLDKAESVDGVAVLHAGTKLRKNGEVLANGGRVLNVIGQGETFKEARQKAYEAVSLIEWKDGFCREDIGLLVEKS